MNDPVAEFLANGGKITKVQTGARAHTDHDLKLAERGEGAAYKGRPQPEDDSEQRAEQEMEYVQQAYHAGGRQASIDALNEFRGHGYDKSAAMDRMNAEYDRDDYDLY